MTIYNTIKNKIFLYAKAGFACAYILFFINLALSTSLLNGQVNSIEKRLFMPNTMQIDQSHLKQSDKIMELSPKNLVIFFDWDGVMVESNNKERIAKIVENPLQMTKLLLGNLIGIIIPNYIFKAVKNAPSHTAEVIARNLERIDPLLAGFILQLGNVNYPKKGMKELVEQLKNAGYDLAIVTNKEPELFNLEYTKPILKELYNLFSKILMVDQQTAPQEMGNIVETNLLVKKSSVKKPAMEYYTQAEEDFKVHNKYVLFIDDNTINFDPVVTHANGQQETQRKENWIGLKFENPQQLKKDLIDLGILHQEEEALS